jgi:hypothetical protein
MTTQRNTSAEEALAEADAVDIVSEKLADAGIPGAAIEFDPDEAEEAGAFEEDALTELDAYASSLVDLGAGTTPPPGFLTDDDIDPAACPLPEHITLRDVTATDKPS